MRISPSRAPLCPTSHATIRRRGEGLSPTPGDRHTYGLVLDFTREQNLLLQRFREPECHRACVIKNDAVRKYARRLIDQYDVRSGQGPVTVARSMSGGNQQKAIIAREVDRDLPLIVVDIRRGGRMLVSLWIFLKH